MLKGTHTEHDQIGARQFRMIQHLKPIAYHNAQGQLQRITNTLGSTGNPAFPIGVDELVQFRIRGKLTGNAPVVYFGKGQTHVRFTPLDTYNVDGKVDGNSITFHEAWDNADLKLTVAGHRLQKDVILRSGHPKTFAFRIDDHAGFDPNTLQTADFRVLQPVLNDPLTHLAIPLTWIVSESGGKTILTVNLPTGDHAGKILDPTLTLQPDAAAGDDTRLEASAPTANRGTGTDLGAGEHITGTTNIQRTLIKFDLSSLPASAVISSATLSLWLAYAGTNSASVNRAFEVYRVRRAWVETEATWNIYSTGNNWGTAGCANTSTDREAASIGTSSTWQTTDAQYATRDTSLSPTSKAALDLGNGWLLQMQTETNDLYYPCSSDHGTAGYRPKLVIIYTPIIDGDVSISSVSSMSSTPLRLRAGSGSIQSVSSLSITAGRIAAAISAIQSISSLAADGDRTCFAISAIDAIPSLTIDGYRIASANAAINAISSLLADPSVWIPGACSINSISSLAIDGDRIASAIAAIQSIASLTADGDRVASAIAAIAVIASLTADQLRIRPGVADINAISSLLADPSVWVPGAVAISAIASLLAGGDKKAGGVASIESIASLLADGNRTASGIAAIASVASLVADGYRTASGIVAIAVVSSLIANGAKWIKGEVAITTTGSLEAAAIAYIVQSFGYTGTLTTGDVLVIDTDAMTVKLNSSSTRPLMTGTFPLLYVGTNELRYKDSEDEPSLWSCDSNSDTIYQHSGDTATLTTSFSSPGAIPRGLTWDGTNLWSCDDATNSIYKHSGGTSTITTSISSPSTGPSGLTWDGTNLWSIDLDTDTIYQHSGETATITTSFSSPSTFPRGLAWDGTNLWSCDNAANNIYQHLGGTSTITTSFSTPGTNIGGLTWDGTNLWSCDWTKDTIYKHSGGTATITTSFSSNGILPSGLAYEVTRDLTFKTVHEPRYL